MMKKIVTFGALCALLLTSCRSAGAVQTSGSSQSDGIQQAARVQVENVDTQVITVTSRETVKVVPDMAEIVFGVTSQNADAAVCQQENQEKVNQLVEKLKEARTLAGELASVLDGLEINGDSEKRETREIKFCVDGKKITQDILGASYDTLQDKPS